MVEAWYLNECEERDITIEEEKLKEVSGVLLFRINVDVAQDDKLEVIIKTRGYTYIDEVELDKEKMPNLDKMLKNFFREHQHSEEEIRLILEGGGYFDVRDKDDKWIRVHTVKGDLIVLPAGIFHRFKMDEMEYTKYKRMFITSPIWKATNRDEIPDSI